MINITFITEVHMQAYKLKVKIEELGQLIITETINLKPGDVCRIYHLTVNLKWR